MKVHYKNYIRSDEWKTKRQAKLDACNAKCECEGGCIREATQVHHLHYETLGNESLEDLQALCPKCHMAKSNKVRNFYGKPIRNCCLLKGQQDVERILPYHVWNEANFHYQMAHTDIEKARHHRSTPQLTKSEIESVAEKLQVDPVIVALLEHLGIMFACGDICVEENITKAIGKFVDIVYSDYFGGDIYEVKPEFQKHFPHYTHRDEEDEN